MTIGLYKSYKLYTTSIYPSSFSDFGKDEDGVWRRAPGIFTTRGRLFRQPLVLLLEIGSIFGTANLSSEFMAVLLYQGKK